MRLADRKQIKCRQPHTPKLPRVPIRRTAPPHQQPRDEDTTSAHGGYIPRRIHPPERRKDKRPRHDRDSDGPSSDAITVHERDGPSPAHGVASDVRHILHLERGEDDAADEREPVFRCRRLIVVEAGDAHRAGTVAHVAEGIEQISGHDADVRAVEVIVHPRHDHQGDGLAGAT